MSLSRLLVRDVTIVRPGTSDDNGDTVKDWTAATSTAVKGWVAQRSTTEVLGNREAVVSGWVLYLHAGADVRPGDRVTVGSSTFEVDGEPWPAWTPRGEHHVEANLRRVDG